MRQKVLSDKERRDWLRLSRTENVGPVTFAHLIERFGNASAALEALPSLSRRGGRLMPLHTTSIAEAEAEIEAGSKLGAQLLCRGEPLFPKMLDASGPVAMPSCSTSPASPLSGLGLHPPRVNAWPETSPLP
jgi:DNA processing protein